MEGNASFTGPGGTGIVRAGEAVALDEAGPRTLREAAALFPLPQARLLNPGPGPRTVRFRWNRLNTGPDEPARLEIAEDRSFSRIVYSGEHAGDTASAELPDGSYFWRVSLVNGEGPSPNVLSFKVLSAAAPALLSPAEGYRYQFRLQRPSVRFRWTAVDEAALYMLEAADNPEMTNPALSQQVRGTSLYVSELGPGAWYWRVRPVFPAAFEGAAAKSLPASFSITRSGDLRSPELQIPRNQGTVNVAAGQGGVYFSWRPEAEARSYRILISANRDLSNPLADETVRDNFYVHRPGQTAMMPGQYYWAVSQTDTEGNDSAFSPAHVFTALEGEMIQTLVFPPDGYVTEASMLPDLRFTWKTNLPFQTRFQVSKDSGFSSAVIDEAAGGEAFQGRILPEGTWYWRIQARDRDAVFETPLRSFTVAPPIAAPQLRAPAPGSRVLIQEQPLVFSWAASEGAEYYQFKLYHEADRNAAVYENNLAEEPMQSLSLEGNPDGNYYWTVRGLAMESARNTRRTGLFLEGVFNARKIRPVHLDYPDDGAGLEGLRAYRESVTLRWSSTEQVKTSRFILSTRSDLTGPPAALIDNPPQRITLPRLQAGNYYWTIQAESFDGFDISATTPHRFRVLPIPLLPAAANRLPEDEKIIGAADLRANRYIVFSWNAVAGATGYLFALENADTGKIAMRHGPMAETTLSLEDLTLLDVGTFIWRVEAVFAEPAGEDTGEIIQRGRIGENRFTIALRLPGMPEPRKPGILYGR
jgi:hypothetical protein